MIKCVKDRTAEFLRKVDEVDERFRSEIESETDPYALRELQSMWMSERFKLEDELLRFILPCASQEYLVI